jgi:hypothetical protein
MRPYFYQSADLEAEGQQVEGGSYGGTQAELGHMHVDGLMFPATCGTLVPNVRWPFGQQMRIQPVRDRPTSTPNGSSRT